ncbi:MAG: heterodisulfide reductase-related iron-sulfur binding cluster [Candidatus Nanopelagicales bacterium]
MGGAEETREVFDGFSPAAQITFYVLGTLAILVFLYGAWLRIRKYRRGRPALRGKVIWHNLKHPFSIRDKDTVSVGRLAANGTIVKRNHWIGLAHFAVFWGFIALFIGTVILTIDADIVRKLSATFGDEEVSFFQGTFYLAYSFILDTLGLAAAIGLIYLAVRRGRAPARLDYTRAEQPEEGYSRKNIVLGDWVFIGLFAGILLTGFVIEGLRIVEYDFPPWEVWSPVGWILARGFAALGMTAAVAGTLHLWFWWIHALLALGFIAYIPFSKAMHIIIDAVNLLATDKNSVRHLPDQDKESGHIGYRQLSDFTWKELLDLDACTKCGRCHEVCPARTGGAPLSPRDLILDLRQWVDTQSGGVTLLDREDRDQATGPLAGADATVAGDVIKASTLWSCTTCMACVEACPVGIEHVPTIVEMRRTLVDEGTMDPTLQQTLQNLASQGNSFGKSARQRARWTKGLDVKIKDARKEPVKYLWYVGDYASFDERLQANTRLLATVLTEAGVDFGILYEGERNTGNDVRRVGEEGLFEMLAESNIEALQAAEFEEIFTTDPHTLNALRNEYPELGASYIVWHYTELLVRLIESGDLRVGSLDRKVTYHDPCYLGRYNGVVDAPRRLLELIGCELVEMPRNKKNSFCCGAGGGRIWMDDSILTERPSENRIREAATLDVGSFVVSCPKDMSMFSDAAKTTGHDEAMTVIDIVGLVDEAMVREGVPA